MNTRFFLVLVAFATSASAFPDQPNGNGKPDSDHTAEAKVRGKKQLGLMRRPESPRLPQSEEWADYEKARLRLLELGEELRAEQAKAGPEGRDRVRAEWLEKHKAELDSIRVKAQKLSERASSDPAVATGAPRVKQLAPQSQPPSRVDLNGVQPAAGETAKISTTSTPTE